MEDASEGGAAPAIPERKPVFTILRVVAGLVAASFLVWLTLENSGADLSRVLEMADGKWLAAMVSVQGFALCLMFVRWRMLLAAQGIGLPFSRVARLGMIGYFFNLAIPGAVGGDVVKMGYIMRHAPEKRVEAAFTILLDRLFGLVGLLALACVAIVFHLDFIRGLGEDFIVLKSVAYAIGSASAVVLAGILAVELFALLPRSGLAERVARRGAEKLPARLVSAASRLAGALEVGRKNRKVAVAALAMSLAIHLVLSLSLWCAGRAVRESEATFGQYVLAVQAGNAAACVPVTPAGLGTRDMVGAFFLRAAGVERELSGAIPVLLTLSILFWGLCGGAVFILKS